MTGDRQTNYDDRQGLFMSGSASKNKLKAATKSIFNPCEPKKVDLGKVQFMVLSSTDDKNSNSTNGRIIC